MAPQPLPARLGSLLLLSLVPWLPGCGGGGDVVLTERTDSAGVSLVVSRGEDRPLDWTFEPVLTLGGADVEGPETFYRLWQGAVATDAAGRTYVLDRGSYRVVVFDSTGEHVRTVGRRGGGPGELQAPVGLDVTPDGTIGVLDRRKRAVVRWSADSASRPAQLEVPPFEGGRFAFTEDGLLLAVMDTTATTDVMLIRLGPDPTRIVRHTGPEMTPMGESESCPISLWMPPLFHPALNWAPGPDGDVFVHHTPAYRIDRYRDGALVESWRRDVAPVPVTPELARREVGEGTTIELRSGRCTIPPDEVIEMSGSAELIPVLDFLAVSPDGRLWARRGGIRGEPRPIDVFGPTGIYEGTLPAGAPYPLAFGRKGEVLASTRDSLDVQRLVVYRVIREPPGQGR